MGVCQMWCETAKVLILNHLGPLAGGVSGYLYSTSRDTAPRRVGAVVTSWLSQVFHEF